jgi:hypothetical protein
LYGGGDEAVVTLFWEEDSVDCFDVSGGGWRFGFLQRALLLAVGLGGKTTARRGSKEYFTNHPVEIMSLQ